MSQEWESSLKYIPETSMKINKQTKTKKTINTKNWLARGLRMAWVNCISPAETGFCTKRCTSDEQTPRPPSPAHHKTFRPQNRFKSFAIPLTLRCRRVWSSNLSTQLRRTQGLNTESLKMPATVADPNRSLNSEQISPATIAHHTVSEKIRNLHQSHMCQWGAQPYLVGPLSRLVGKPPFRHGCQGIFCLWKELQMDQTAPFHRRRHSTAFHFVFITVCTLGYKKQKTGIGEQSCLPQP